MRPEITAEIYLDGDEMKNVVEASTVHGYVYVVDIDNKGNIRIDKDGNVQLKKLVGEVDIIVGLDSVNQSLWRKKTKCDL